MDKLLHEIQERLDRERLLFGRLLEVVERERDILLEGEHLRLVANSEEKVELCQELAGVQKERRELMARLVPAEEQAPDLDGLVRMAPAEMRVGLKSRLNELRRLARRLDQLNRRNQEFLEDALDTVEHLMGVLAGGKRQAAYRASGRQEALAGPRLLAREV